MIVVGGTMRLVGGATARVVGNEEWGEVFGSLLLFHLRERERLSFTPPPTIFLIRCLPRP